MKEEEGERNKLLKEKEKEDKRNKRQKGKGKAENIISSRRVKRPATAMSNSEEASSGEGGEEPNGEGEQLSNSEGEGDDDDVECPMCHAH